ncbi:MAG: SO_0444 family Cu/Zn efflux transporter [Bacteroidota bacterium]
MEAVTTYALGFLRDFITILGEMSPYLLLGFFFAGVLHAFIPKNRIHSFLGGNTLRSSFNASLFGVPLPLCSCGVIPAGISLFKNGASKGSTNSFLISTPQTGIDSILVTYSLLGLPFAIIRPIIALVTGVFGGMITNKIDPTTDQVATSEESTAPNRSLTQKIVEVFKYGFVVFLQDISKWLVIGLVLAALISVVIPDSFFANQGLPLVLQMLLMLVFSIPLYVCATASVPLAAILIIKGMSPGAALVLLMAGPATNAATITMIGNVLGKKSLIAYLSSIIGGALLFGFIIDAFLPAQWFTQVMHGGMGHDHQTQLTWIELASGVILSLLIINGSIQKRFTKQEEHTSMAAKIITVEGMTCNHCKANVEQNLEKLPFVDRATVNLSDHTVTIEGDTPDLATIEETVNGLGYRYISTV